MEERFAFFDSFSIADSVPTLRIWTAFGSCYPPSCSLTSDDIIYQSETLQCGRLHTRCISDIWKKLTSISCCHVSLKKEWGFNYPHYSLPDSLNLYWTCEDGEIEKLTLDDLAHYLFMCSAHGQESLIWFCMVPNRVWCTNLVYGKNFRTRLILQKRETLNHFDLFINFLMHELPDKFWFRSQQILNIFPLTVRIVRDFLQSCPLNNNNIDFSLFLLTFVKIIGIFQSSGNIDQLEGFLRKRLGTIANKLPFVFGMYADCKLVEPREVFLSFSSSCSPPALVENEDLRPWQPPKEEDEEQDMKVKQTYHLVLSCPVLSCPVLVDFNSTYLTPGSLAH